MNQIWKDIKNYEGLYQCSNWGRVKSFYKGGRILKPNKRGDYWEVGLYKKGQKTEWVTIHRLVFETFFRRLLPNEDCHHINEDKNCNISTNLVARDSYIHLRDHNIGNQKCKGKKFSKQHRENLSKAKKGLKLGSMSQQHKQKISEAIKGKTRSLETIAKREETKRLKRLADPNYGRRKANKQLEK